jgi:hypothetical protein
MIRAVPFRDVLHDVLQWDGGTAAGEATISRAGTACVMINAALELAWEYHDWPETIRCEERAVTNGLVPWEHEDSLIGLPIIVWNDDPQTNEKARTLKFTELRDGLRVLNAPATVWVEHQETVPVFSADQWDDLQPYVTGAVVYDSMDTGACYVAKQMVPAGTALTSAAHWRALEFPALLRQAVVQGAIAGLRSSDAEEGSGAVKLTSMQAILDSKVELLETRAGRTRTYRRTS